MAKRNLTRSYNFSLRGKTSQEMRELLFKHSDEKIDFSSLSQQSLMVTLSDLAARRPALRKELQKSEIALKPSFYLMLIRVKSEAIGTVATAASRLEKAIQELNSDLTSQSETPTLKSFSLENLNHRNKTLIQIELSWHRVYWYWQAPTVLRSYVYEMQFGHIFLDLDSKKAIISCHTIRERDHIVRILETSYLISLSPLVLTRPVLEQIGKFEQLKRGAYFRLQSDANLPSNVTYADERLATKSEARKLEGDPGAQRKQSYYLIPLGSILEQGVGATSDSGKLWIPKEVPVSTIADYAFQLLRKVARTLNKMAKEGDIGNVLDTLDIPKLPRIVSIRNKKIRDEVCLLLYELVNMIISGENERPQRVNETLAIDAVPQYFMYPRVQLTDPETEEKAFWTNESSTSQFVEVSRSGRLLTLRGHPNLEILNVKYIRHPISGESVSVVDPLQSLQLVPTAELIEILFDSLMQISQQIPQLTKIQSMPFYIHAGTLRLDLNRAQGRSGFSAVDIGLQPSDTVNLRAVARRIIPTTQEPIINKRLATLKELCRHESDMECGRCVQTRRFICLRSLLGRYLLNPQILAHKGIELADVQGELLIADEANRAYVFSKLNPGKTGLTFRNSSGAILFAQVAAQLDKTDFSVVVILTSSVINQDLVERLRTYCSIFGKKLLIVDNSLLQKMLVDFEENANYDKLDLKKIYSSSWIKGRIS